MKVTEGHSKTIEYLGDGLVDIRLKPTVYSYTHNRNGMIPGSHILRLKACAILIPLLQRAGVDHSYTEHQS